MENVDDKPAIDKISIGDAVEYFEDLGLEYDVDYKDLAKEKMTRTKKNKELSEEVEDDFFIIPLDTQVFSIYPYWTSKNKGFLNGLRKFLIKLGEINKESQINSLYLYKRSENNIFKYND